MQQFKAATGWIKERILHHPAGNEKTESAPMSQGAVGKKERLAGSGCDDPPELIQGEEETVASNTCAADTNPGREKSTVRCRGVAGREEWHSCGDCDAPPELEQDDDEPDGPLIRAVHIGDVAWSATRRGIDLGSKRDISC